jgi:hypothetical protein
MAGEEARGTGHRTPTVGSPSHWISKVDVPRREMCHAKLFPHFSIEICAIEVECFDFPIVVHAITRGESETRSAR